MLKKKEEVTELADIEMKSYVDALMSERRNYYDTKLDSANKESIMRFDHMMRSLVDLEKRLLEIIDNNRITRLEFTNTIQKAFEERSREIDTIDAKNDIRLSLIEDNIKKILSSYAEKDSVDAATQLAKDSLDTRLALMEREHDVIHNQIKEATISLSQLIDKGNEASRDRLTIMTKQSDDHVNAQAQMTHLMTDSIDARFSSIEKATEIANSALDKRLEAMNQFREQLRDQASRFVTREETEAKVKTFDPIIQSFTTRIGELEKNKANGEGKMWAFGFAITLFSVGASIALHFIK